MGAAHTIPQGGAGGKDFVSVEVLTQRGLLPFFVLFSIQLASRKLEVAGITLHPNEQ